MSQLLIQASVPYALYFHPQVFKSELLKNLCSSLKKRVVVITDSIVNAAWGEAIQSYFENDQLSVSLFSFPAGESYKTRETKQFLEDQLLKARYGRDTCIIALGGGVVLDVAGFLAATYCRGVPVIYIPTTLLAMVDACVGGKTGVNTPFGKNLIGTITAPYAVIMDIEFLKTLPHAEWKNGYVEMLKHGLLADMTTFNQLKAWSDSKYTLNSQLQELIRTSCQIKKSIVEQDETEKGPRQLLNFGHTIGHAIEMMEEYRISHGEAVAIGLLVECYLSQLCGILNLEILPQLFAVLNAYELPLKTHVFSDQNRFVEHLVLDKKTVMQIPRFVLLESIGQVKWDVQNYTWSVEMDTLKQALFWANQQFGN